MIYGTLQAAMEYADRGCIKEWLQLFLRGDGHNVALADGLLLEPRQYWGPVEIELKLLDGIQSGVPEYLSMDDEIAYFFDVVDRMKDAYKTWDTPPLILEYAEDGIRVNDGRHRLEMYRQLGIKKAWAVCWKTREKVEVRDFLKLPLFFITGASGVGKTTAAQILQRKTQYFIVLDADMFYNIMPHDTEEDALNMIEQIMYFSRNVMQCGKPLVWTKAGNIDKLSTASGNRYFSEIACLALVCSDEQLQSRMINGRGIKDAEWIRSSLDYNKYFLEHDKIGDTHYELLGVDNKTPEETAAEIEHWLIRKMMAYSDCPDIPFPF